MHDHSGSIRPRGLMFSLLCGLFGAAAASANSVASAPVSLHQDRPATLHYAEGTSAVHADRGGRCTPPPGFTLIWADEFNTDGAPDPTKWNFEHGFVRNREPQWYQPQNATVSGGRLIIEGRREYCPNPHYDPDSSDWRYNRPHADYTSASLTTKGTFHACYGIFEIRARFLPAEGMWPAFWTKGITGSWPACGEIDILEYFKGAFASNLIWSAPHAGRRAINSKRYPLAKLIAADPHFADKYHTYTMEWDAEMISLYLDDLLLNRVELSALHHAHANAVSHPFRQPHFILLNLALGATGGSLKDLSFPARYEVDYVRVFAPQTEQPSNPMTATPPCVKAASTDSN